MRISGSRGVIFLLGMALALSSQSAKTQTGWGLWAVADPGCTTSQAWFGQENPASDGTNTRNIAYPEGDTATYWGTLITGALGSTLTINGQFPAARYMAMQTYDSNHNVLSAINDQSINPDAGQNNPFRAGSTTALGTYTLTVVFGSTPTTPAANTLYTGDLTQVALVYRVYYPNSSSTLTGGTSKPTLPNLTQGGKLMSTCSPRPVLPDSSTVNGHIQTYDFTGVAPTTPKPATSPPTMLLTVTNANTPYYPSADNNYMSAYLSRKYLAPPYNYNMVVMTMKAPTFSNTQAGDAPYLATTSKQVRFWSVCEDDPLTTGVARCVADNQAPSLNGYVTFVFSDPSYKPSSSVLSQWGASWLGWGALTSSDTVYDINGTPQTNASGVYYNGLILYRQTMANPSWKQSMYNVGQLSRTNWQTAMGAYWPTIGYCTAANFQTYGAGCIGR